MELISADDILDLCHSPVSTGTCSSSQKRIKILEFNKNQCKKSPPNSYKSLIKQAEPKSYLCLSRKFDKRHHRYGRLQGKSTKQGNSTGVRRRQLILTDQQRKRLQLRKKKLLALERRKQEAREKRRAAAKQKRLEQQQLKVAKAAEAARLSIANVDDEIVDLDADDLEEEKTAVTLIGTSPKCNQLLAGGSGNTPKSSPKHLPKKKYVLPTHLLETIDAVARGYFSEPEAPRCTIYGSGSSGSNGPSTACVTPTTQVGRKYKKTKTSEARSKSETKKPLKLSTLAVPSNTTDQRKAPETATAAAVPVFANAARAQKTTSIQLEREIATVEAASTLNDLEQEMMLERENEEITTTTTSKQTKNKTKKEIEYTAAAASTKSATKRANRKRNAKKGKKRTTKSKTKSNRKSVKSTTTTTTAAITPLHHITQSKVSATAEKLLEQAKAVEEEEEEEATLQSIITAKIAADNIKTSDKLSNISAAEEKLTLLETNNNEYEKSTTTTTATTPSAEHVLPQAPILHQQQQQPQNTHSEFMFLPPAPPVPRIVCHPHHPTKRTRSRSKFGCRKRQKLKHSVSYEVDETLPPMTRSSDVVPKWNNGWTWEGEAFQGAVFLNVSTMFRNNC